MAEFNGMWQPETEAEWNLLRGLLDVTGQAKEDGVPSDAIVTATIFAAVSIHEFGDEEMPEPPEGPVDVRREDCPECGEEIVEVFASVGGDCEVSPCGCVVDAYDVPKWVGL